MHLSLLSADLILLILEVTDPESLLQFCRASRWIYYLVMESKTLRYQIELALSGMKDGPPSEHSAPARLEQLLTYKNAWPALTWSREDRLEISRPTIMGVSGGFFYHASEDSDHDFQWTLELYELRSFRAGRSASSLRRFKFNVSFDINDVVIDLSQNLLVLVELDQPNGTMPICARLRCHDLWTCAVHPSASAHLFTLQTHWWSPLLPGQHVYVKQVQVCGSRIALAVRLETVEVGEGSTEIVIVDWHGNKTKRWSADVLSFQFVSESRILVALQSSERSDGHLARRPSLNDRQTTACASKGTLTPRLVLCDISNFADRSFSWLRVYKLPETWKALSSIDIRPNLSPIDGTRVTSGTYFYPDPSGRIVVVSINLNLNEIPAGRSQHIMVVLEESFLRPAVRNEPTVLEWSQWGQHCLLRNISDRVYSYSVIGRRLILLESVEDMISPRSRLRAIEFNPRSVGYAQNNLGSQPAWACSSRGTTLSSHIQSGKISPRVRSNSIDVDDAFMVGATEDNLVLFHEDDDGTLVRILTFGKAPTTRARYRESRPA